MILLIVVAAAVLNADAPPVGYLAGQPPLDWAKLLPGPPKSGSAADAADRATYAASAAGVGGRSWQAAITQLHPGRAAAMAPQIACIVAAPVDAASAPALFRLLARLGADAYAPVKASKDFYHRDRPFVGDTATVTCDPRANSGELSFAYPSGHAAIGTLWGAALGDVAPDRRGIAKAWGAAVGDNRIACRVHWASDVAAGRTLGAALYKRVEPTPAYRADVAAARAEITALRTRDTPPLSSCG